jgi:MFS family permease
MMSPVVPPPPSPSPGARGWSVVALLWLVACMDYLTRVMLTTMHTSIVAAIPMTETEFGLLTSSFLWVYGFFSPVAGFLSDRFSRSRVIFCSLLAWSLLTLMTAYARTFGELLAMRALMGMSQACYLPAALALITEYHRGPTRSLAVGVHMTGIMVGSALSGLGGWLADIRSWHYAFSLVGLAGLGYCVAIGCFLRDAPSEGSKPAAEPSALLAAGDGGLGAPVRFGPALSSLFSQGGFILALIFWGALGVISWAITGWMPTLMLERFHLSQGAAGLYTSGYIYAASLAGVLAGGAWADRWSRTRPAARIYVPAIGICIAAPGILLVAQTHVLAWAIAGLVVYGFTRVFSDSNMMPILCLVSDRRYRATGYGVLNCLSCICGGLAIYAGGALRDAKIDLSRVLVYAAGGMVVCAGLLLCVRTRPAP